MVLVVLETLRERTGVPKLYLAMGIVLLASVITIKTAGFAAFW